MSSSSRRSVSTAVAPSSAARRNTSVTGPLTVTVTALSSTDVAVTCAAPARLAASTEPGKLKRRRLAA